VGTSGVIGGGAGGGQLSPPLAFLFCPLGFLILRKGHEMGQILMPNFILFLNFCLKMA